MVLRTLTAIRRIPAAGLHKWLTILWASLALPTVLWWRDSIFWVAFMSLYANVASHWAAYQASRIEEKEKQ